MIDKLKLFQQTPDSIKECQLEADKIPEEDLDEESVEPLVEPEDSQAPVKYIQFVEVVLCSAGLEEVAVPEEKDGN